MTMKVVIGSQIVSPKLAALTERALEKANGDTDAMSKYMADIAENDLDLAKELLGDKFQPMVDEAAGRLIKLYLILHAAVAAMRETGASSSAIADLLQGFADAETSQSPNGEA